MDAVFAGVVHGLTGHWAWLGLPERAMGRRRRFFDVGRHGNLSSQGVYEIRLGREDRLDTRAATVSLDESDESDVVDAPLTRQGGAITLNVFPNGREAVCPGSTQGLKARFYLVIRAPSASPVRRWRG